MLTSPRSDESRELLLRGTSSSSSTSASMLSTSSSSAASTNIDLLEIDFGEQRSDAGENDDGDEDAPPPAASRLPIEYWTADGRCPAYDEILQLLALADDSRYQVRRRPTQARLTEVQFAFDVTEERSRLRVLLHEHRRLVKRIQREVARATTGGIDRIEFESLSAGQIDTARAVAQITGLETYVRCRPVRVPCTTFLPRGAFMEIVRCGCAFVPLEAQRATAIYLRRLPSSVERDSDEERRILTSEYCASMTESRLIYYNEVMVDGIVLVLERRTPRTPPPRDALPPRVQISGEPAPAPRTRRRDTPRSASVGSELN